MEFAILTPAFVHDLIYLATTCLLSREYFEEFELVFDLDKRPAKILTDIEAVLEACKNEPKLLTIQQQLKALQLMLSYKDNGNIIVNEIIDTIQQSTDYDLNNIVIQIRKDLLDGSLKTKIDSSYSRLQQRLEYLMLKPHLEKMKSLITGESAAQLEEFLAELRKQAHEVIQTTKRNITYEVFDSSQLGQTKKLVEKYKEILDPSKYVTTGYSALDNRLYGGFAKTRIYIVAGPSGHGKSTYLLNWLVRALQASYDSMFIYITLENIVPETLLRIASMINKRNVLEEAIQDPNCLDEYLSQAELFLQARGNRTIIQYYNSTTPIEVIIDDIRVYSRESPSLKAVYYDYLNVAGLFSDDIRKELGKIVRKLKDLAVELQVPVITAAQLNREAYDKTNPHDVGLKNIAESMLIVENADVLLLTNNDITPGKAFLQIKKRRYAREGTLHVRYNPDAYLVESIYEFDTGLTSPTSTSTSKSTSTFV